MNNFLLRYRLLFFSMLMCLSASTQMHVTDSIIKAPIISATYSPHLPGGDLTSRVGFHNSIGIYTEFKNKKNWLFGLESNFIFGNSIKENGFLDDFKTSNGQILSPSGGYAIVLLFHRGFNFNATLGKIIPVFGPNKNSGLLVKAGLGTLFHKIRIETQEDFLPYLQDDYKKGFDRFTLGVSLKIFAGYLNFTNNFKRFYIGPEVTTAFTRGMRNYLYDTGMPDQRQRIDIMYGLRIGYILPIYQRTSNQYYTY